MLFYRVKAEADNKPMFKKKNGKIEYWSIYVGGELFTANEVAKMNLNLDYLYPVNVNRRKTHWVFGARLPDDDANITPAKIQRPITPSHEVEKDIIDFVVAAGRPASAKHRNVAKVYRA